MPVPEDAKRFISFMDARYACKRFDPARAPSRELVDYLVECARLSPSAFGLEHTRLIVALDPDLRSALALASGSQEAVASAPLLLLFLVPRAGAYDLDSDFIRGRATRFPGGLPAFKADYEGYYDFLVAAGRLESWARAQSYIALANVMTGAAAAGLDSCAIEGFDEDEALSAVRAEGRGVDGLPDLLNRLSRRAEEGALQARGRRDVGNSLRVPD